jgi:hypothetical protein
LQTYGLFIAACAIAFSGSLVRKFYMNSLFPSKSNLILSYARLRKRLDKPYQLKALLKRGCNQYLQMELDTDTWSIDEEKITSAAKYDGYYAIITNNLELSTEKACFR